MTDSQTMILSTTLYKLLTILVGLAFGYMGFRLFMSGVYEKAGELKTAWGDKQLILKQAAPGTFFALFGTIVLTVMMWKGLTFKQVSEYKGEYSDMVEHSENVQKLLPTRGNVETVEIMASEPLTTESSVEIPPPNVDQSIQEIEELKSGIEMVNSNIQAEFELIKLHQRDQERVILYILKEISYDSEDTELEPKIRDTILDIRDRIPE